MIIHIPHSSRKLNNFVELTNERENLDFLTDDYTAEIFEIAPFEPLRFEYSRFVCDVERFRHNDPMDEKGQGIIYTKDIFGNPIKRNISDEDVYKLYDEHHRKFTRRVNSTLPLFENVVIVDAHSYTGEGPDICIGTDVFHTPDTVVKELHDHFVNNGLSVMINYPFSGSIVPEQHYKKEKRLISVMIEVNKRICENNIVKMKKIIEGSLIVLDEYEFE